jgi:hypothetical protein
MCFQMFATAIWRVWRQVLAAKLDVVELGAGQGSRIARFDRPLPQPCPSSPRAARAFVTTAASVLCSDLGQSPSAPEPSPKT